MGRIEVGAPPGAGGGGGTSSAPSLTPICRVNAPNGAVVPAGTHPKVNFTGGTITGGASLFGAVDLDVTINESGNLVLPDEDATYDVFVFGNYQGNVADAEKMVGARYTGTDGDAIAWFPLSATGGAIINVNCTDRLFVGSDPEVSVRIFADFLTEDSGWFAGGAPAIVFYKR